MDAHELQRRRDERARARRRRRIRRRAGIGTTLAVVVVAVAVAIASASGSGGAARTTASGSARSTPTAAHAPARPRRAADRHARGASTAAVLGPATGVARHGRGAGADVPRHRRAAQGRPVPRPVRAAPGVRGADAGAQAGRLARGDPGPAPGLLEQGGQAPGRAAHRHHLRQRLPLAVRRGAARPAQARLGRRREHPAQRSAPLAGRPDQRRGQGDGGRRLGARHPGHQPRRPHHPGRRAAALPDRQRPQDDPAPLRRARQLVLLPVGPLRHDGDRRRALRRLRRVDHRRARLGRSVQRPLPPAAPARAGRHEPLGAARADRRHPHGDGATGLLRRG